MIIAIITGPTSPRHSFTQRSNLLLQSMVCNFVRLSVGHDRESYRTSGSAMAEGPRDALVSRNTATTKYPYRMALFA